MGVLGNIERRLQSATDRTFTRLFGGHVQPAEVTSALHQEAADHLQYRVGRSIAPNRYIVELGPSDHADVDDDVRRISSAFTGTLGAYVSEQGWDTFAPVDVSFTRSERLHTGQFRVISQYDPDVGHDRRHDGAPGPTRVSEGADPMTPPSGESPADPSQQAQPHRPVPPGARPDYGTPRYNRPQPYYGDPAPSAPPPPGYGQPSSAPQPAAPYPSQPASQPYYGSPQDPHPQPPPSWQDPYGPPGPAVAAPGGGPGYAAPPPVAAPSPILIVDDATGRSHLLQRGSNIVGRGQAAALRIADTSVSRQHADVYFDGHAAIVHDLGSTNGTAVNGSPVQTWQLDDGDVITIGQSTLIFRIR